jgi:hypothetical protein
MISQFHPMPPESLEPSPPRVGGVGSLPDHRARRVAWILAITADFVQIALMPFFSEGVASPANDVLDLIVGVCMVRLLGWHPALLPTLIAELVPGLDLVPTWTIAVWFATRKGRAKPGAH